MLYDGANGKQEILKEDGAYLIPKISKMLGRGKGLMPIKKRKYVVEVRCQKPRKHAHNFFPLAAFYGAI